MSQAKVRVCQFPSGRKKQKSVINKKDEINLCEVKYANTYLTVHKDSWSGSLAKAMDFYIENEQYEVCGKIKKLINKL